MISRREFSKYCLATGAAVLGSDSAWAGSASPVSPDPKADQMCDLLIKGGTVVDPSQHLHAPMDVAVKDGKILEVSADIPETRARQVVPAKDQIVTPGFIDLHVHCFDGVATGFNADRYALGRGVTTVVDAGSTGFPMIGTFVKYIAKPAATRIYAMVEIGATGTMLFRQYPNFWNDVYNMDWVLPELTAKAAMDNRPTAVGIKAHLIKGLAVHPEEFELELLKKALEAADAAQMPLMVHAENTFAPLSRVLKMMRKGDVLTHCYHGFSGGSILDSQGKIFPEVREARDRGILFDVGEGYISFSFDVAERALQQGFLPDSLSSDLTVWATSHVAYDLPTVATKFLALGMDLDKIIERVTVNPAKTFDFGVPIGTLRPGAEADIGIFEVHEGNFELIDNVGETGKAPGKRVGHQKLVNKAAVCRGQLFTSQI